MGMKNKEQAEANPELSGIDNHEIFNANAAIKADLKAADANEDIAERAIVDKAYEGIIWEELNARDNREGGTASMWNVDGMIFNPGVISGLMITK